MSTKTKIDINKDKDKEFQLPCNVCNTETFHKVLASINESGQELIEEHWTLDYWGDYQIIQCQGCRVISFRQVTFTENDFDFNDQGEEVVHKTVEIFPGRLKGRKKINEYWILPSAVKHIYNETHTALCNKIKTLSAIGIRALVETVCKDKGTTSAILGENIDELVTLGVLTKDGAAILHRTRFLGNQAAHEISIPSDEILEVAMDVVEHLLLAVYILPERAKSLPAK